MCGLRLQKPEYKHRIKLLKYHNINLVFDVGANVGLYSHCIRNMGYKGRIVSFEPIGDAYRILTGLSKKDTMWEALNVALGNIDGESDINIAGNSVSSSLLDMLPLLENTAPDSEYIAKEKIKIIKLDSIFDDYYHEGDRAFLKIDAQGYEKNILDGAKDSLSKIRGLQLEMSMRQLYKDEMLFPDMLQQLISLGFELSYLESGWTDAVTGNIMQIDGILFRK